MTQPQITVVPPVAVEPPAALLPPLATESRVPTSVLAQLESWSTQIESSNVNPISFFCTKIGISISRNWNFSIIECAASSAVGPRRPERRHAVEPKIPQPRSCHLAPAAREITKSP